MCQLFQEIHQNHVKLMGQQLKVDLSQEEGDQQLLASQAKELVKKIRSAGRKIRNASQRQRLESYTLYWSRFIAEVTSEYLDVLLCEPEEPLLQTEEVEEKPAKTQDLGKPLEIEKAFQPPLSFNPSPVSKLLKYACPKGDYVWYKRQVGEPIPNCPTHNIPLEQVQP